MLKPMVSTGQERPAPNNGGVLAPDLSVLADQQLLARGGFYGGTPNGYADAAHTTAIRRARRALGLPEGTSFDETLRAKLQQPAPEAPVPRERQRTPIGTAPSMAATAAPAAGSRSGPIVAVVLGLIVGGTWTALLLNRRR